MKRSDSSGSNTIERKGILKSSSKYVDNKYLEILKSHGDQVLKKERQMRKSHETSTQSVQSLARQKRQNYSSRKSYQGDIEQNRVQTEPSLDINFNNNRNSQSLIEGNGRNKIDLMDVSNTDQYPKISNLAYSPHNPIGRSTLNQGRLQDLCAEDKRKLGDLIKKLGDEKEEKERLKKKLDNDTNLFQERLSEFQKENQSILENTEDLNSRFQYSLRLLQNCKDIKGDNNNNQGSTSRSRLGINKQESKNCSVNDLGIQANKQELDQGNQEKQENQKPTADQENNNNNENNVQINTSNKNLDQHPQSQGLVRNSSQLSIGLEGQRSFSEKQLVVPFLSNKSTINGNMFPPRSKKPFQNIDLQHSEHQYLPQQQQFSSRFEESSRQKMEQQQYPTQDSLDVEVREFLQSSIRPSNLQIIKPTAQQMKDSLKMQQSSSVQQLQIPQQNQSFAKYVNHSPNYDANKASQKQFPSNAELIKKQLNIQNNYQSKKGENQQVGLQQQQKERLTLQAQHGQSENILKHKCINNSQGQTGKDDLNSLDHKQQGQQVEIIEKDEDTTLKEIDDLKKQMHALLNDMKSINTGNISNKTNNAALKLPQGQQYEQQKLLEQYQKQISTKVFKQQHASLEFDDRDFNEGEDDYQSEIEISEKMIENKKNRLLECLREIRKDDFLDSGTTSFSSSLAQNKVPDQNKTKQILSGILPEDLSQQNKHGMSYKYQRNRNTQGNNENGEYMNFYENNHNQENNHTEGSHVKDLFKDNDYFKQSQPLQHKHKGNKLTSKNTFPTHPTSFSPESQVNDNKNLKYKVRSLLSLSSIVKDGTSLEQLGKEEIVRLSRILGKRLKEMSESVSYDVSSQEDQGQDDDSRRLRLVKKQLNSKQNINSTAKMTLNSGSLLSENEFIGLSISSQSQQKPGIIHRGIENNTERKEILPNGREPTSTKRQQQDYQTDEESYIFVDENPKKESKQQQQQIKRQQVDDNGQSGKGQIQSDNKSNKSDQSNSIMEQIDCLSEKELTEVLRALKQKIQTQNQGSHKQQQGQVKQSSEESIEDSQTSQSIASSQEVRNRVYNNKERDQNMKKMNNNSRNKDQHDIEGQQQISSEKKSNKSQNKSNKVDKRQEDRISHGNNHLGRYGRQRDDYDEEAQEFMDYEESLFQVVDEIENNSQNNNKNHKRDGCTTETDQSIAEIQQKVQLAHNKIRL